MVTHDDEQWEAVRCIRLATVAGFSDPKIDVIGIDEGQFFPDLVEVVDRAANNGKIVIVAALDGTFMRVPFSGMNELVSKADKVLKLYAVCMECKKKEAPFSVRLTEQKEEVVIGGKAEYKAVCRECYNKLAIGD